MFRLATKSVVTSCTRRSGVGAATAAAAVAAALIASKSGSGECEAPPRDPAIAAATDKGGEPWAPFNNSAGSTCNGRLRTLYPPLEPYNSGCLRVSKKHSIYWEESGCREGKPVIFLHGGPGAGCCGASSSARRFHDPKKYRIITFDQRGSGNSLPSGCLEDNSTWSLVADIEHLRRMLKIDKWQVFGGSWGSFLALAYAEKHPDRCTELVLRGIFMLRPEELRWFYQEGANHIYPDAWEHYVAAIPLDEQNDFMTAFRKRLTGADEEERLKAARAWSTWELSTCRLVPHESSLRRVEDDKWALAFARIENHYFVNKGWLPYPDYLLDNVDRIRHIPGVIVQGRYDVVCPMKTSYDLHKRWPEATYEVVTAGHSATDPKILDALIRATDRFASETPSPQEDAK